MSEVPLYSGPTLAHGRPSKAEVCVQGDLARENASAEDPTVWLCLARALWWPSKGGCVFLRARCPCTY